MVEQYRVDLPSGKYLASITNEAELEDAIAYYQEASYLYEYYALKQSEN